MRSLFLFALLSGAALTLHAQQPPSFVMAACSGETTHLAEVTLPRPVVADGKTLPAGRYELRLTTEHPAAVPGATAAASCWVQFFRDGTMAGRELATVIEQADIASIAKEPAPKPDQPRVELLKGGEYYRIWINHEGTNYIINVPPAS